MNKNDWKNGEVKEISLEEYDESKNKYMQAYSFVMSWGWRRIVAHVDEDSEKHYKWVDKNREYACDTVYEAQSIQRLRILTGVNENG